MAISLESCIERLTDKELKECFFDIIKWRVDGVLSKDSLVRKVWNNYKDLSGDYNFPIHAVPEAIFFEICKRKYQSEGSEG